MPSRVSALPAPSCTGPRRAPAFHRRPEPASSFRYSRARNGVILRTGEEMRIQRIGGGLLVATLLACFVLVLSGIAGSPPSTGKPPLPTIDVPDPDIGAQTLPARKAAQEATRKDFHVDCDFKFTDRQPESGITFEHHIVDDAGRFCKAKGTRRRSRRSSPRNSGYR